MQPTQVKDFTPGEAVLAVALELAKGSWKVALPDGRRERPAVHTVAHAQAAGRLAEAVQVVEATRRRWQLDAATPVVVIYEAGQDGFWIERALTGLGYAVKVVDPASLPVARRARECERLALAERQLKTL
ncbi:MAG TPA: IS110 family transposase, partial [Gammaproteobacteria bacterium]|nr:IS110 family transposase [Gammaproteobacteria bacterium]